MYLLLSWRSGEAPHLDLLPVTDAVALLKVILTATREGREVQIYLAHGDQLQLIYPDAEVVSIGAGLIPK